MDESEPLDGGGALALVGRPGGALNDFLRLLMGKVPVHMPVGPGRFACHGIQRALYPGFLEVLSSEHEGYDERIFGASSSAES